MAGAHHEGGKLVYHVCYYGLVADSATAKEFSPAALHQLELELFHPS